MNEEIEIWKDIAGYEGYYQVSNFGRIKSMPRKVRTFYGFKQLEESILSPTNNKGYLTFGLSKYGIRKHKMVHIIVAIEFLGHTPNGHSFVVDHINGDTLNNNLSNLQIVTHSQNMQTCFQGEKTGFTSVYRGVYYVYKSSKWACVISYKNKQFHLGHFKSELDANECYTRALNSIRDNSFEIYYSEIKRKYSSEYKGVYWCKAGEYWRASIRINGKKKHLGCFINEIDAANAYKDALTKIKQA